MDIIITGEQGAGKTRAAETLLKAMRYSDSEVLFIHDMYPAPGLTREMIRAARVRCVVFDGPIVKPRDLVNAVKLIKHYRREINADILALYVCPGDAVMITDGEPPINEFRSSAPGNYGRAQDREFMERVERRTDKILVDLWDLVAGRVDEIGSDLMIAELTRLASAAGIGKAGETAGLHHLDADGKIELHKFLLDLLRKYE